MTSSHAILAPLLVLLGVVGAVTYQAEVAPRHVDRCADVTRALDPTAIDPRSIPGSDDEWRPVVEGRGVRKGTIPAEEKGELEMGFLVQRTWGLPTQLLNPAKAIPGRLEADRIRLRPVEVGGREIPVHFADQTARNMVHFAMYTYAYDGRAVESAFGTRFGSIFDELLNGSRPITVLAVATRVEQFRQAKGEAQAEEWIRKAWTNYQRACGFESVSSAPPDRSTPADAVGSHSQDDD
ncbi:MAG: hypothetical protein ACQGVK_26130 [Myxococcota bacterium]